jgi:dienelactone hydrolase
MKNYYPFIRSGFVALVVLFCFFSPGLAQTYPAQTPVQSPLCTYVNGYYEWLPADYNTNTTKKYPVIIFIHGIGECGNGTTQLSRLLVNGPPKLIQQQTFPTSFTVNGQVFSFIVISPQFTGQYRDADDFNEIINNVKTKYRVDENRIYLTGLSMGGGLSWWYSSAKQSYAEGLAAMAIVCGNFNANGTGVANLARANLPIKIFHNDGDPTVLLSWSQNWFNQLNAFTPAMSPKPTLTVFNSTSHDAWSRTYDPNYKENNLNVYEWMLTHARNSAVNAAPVVGAGNDITITLPTNQVTLNGSATDPDGTIASYAWAKIEGPTSYTITSPNSAQTTVTNMVAGVYRFELTATDNTGAVDKDTVAVTVNAAPTGSTCKANAGPDQTIERGVASSAVLDGSASTGSSLSYSWRLLTAVTSDWKSNLKNANRSKADVIILPYLDGGYKYELTVSDGQGCSSKDTTNVFVNWGRMPYRNTEGKAWHVATATDMSRIPNAKIGDLIIDGANNGNISAGPVDINILLTDQISLTAGQKVLIRGGRYGMIRLNFTAGRVRGTRANPVIITNYDGQVECTAMAISNVVGAKLTGKYEPGVSGDVNFQGHNNGNYAFSRGKYGIFCNAAWGSLSSSGLQVWGPGTDSLEIEYMEIGNGHFAGMMIKDDNGTKDYNDFYIHDLYIHDIHGEGVYMGSTGADPQHQLNSLKFENVRIVNAGNEIFQFGQVGYGSIVKNNVFINSANNRRSTFANYQDNGAQFNYRSGNQQFRNNILLGTGNAAFNAFIGSKTGSRTPNDSIYICNNLVKYGAGSLGAYLASTNALPTTVVKIDSNYFGGFYFTADQIYSDSRGVNTTTLFRIANGLQVLFRNNKSDGTKSVMTTGTSVLSGNTVSVINNPNFVNSGWPASFDFCKLTEWGDFIFNTWKDEFANPTGVKFNNPIAFQAGDYVTFLSKTYRSKVSNNHGHVPQGRTDDYWELVTWSGSGVTYTYPPDDYRLVDGDEYKKRNIGLTDLTVAPPPPNNPPVANAGTDRTVTLPVDTLRLSGMGTDSDGTIALYQWTKVGGPATLTITGDNTATPILSNLVAGVYQFELLVSDDKGATDKDTVVITVNPAPNQAPEVYAGQDINITIPLDSTTLTGQASDDDGNIVSYLWTKVSGPAAYTLINPNSAITEVKGLTVGEYWFELTVTDNSGATAKDTVKVIVGYVPVTPNVPPVANAGTDITITLPVNNTTLNGIGTDSDGTIASYQWKKVSGPSGYSITNSTSANTAVTGLWQGVYEFELTVRDDKGAIDRDTVRVTVLAANVPPVANAGQNITIILPTNSTTLSGSGTDIDGSVVGYEWKKLSGPSGYSITNPAAASTTVTGLTEGVYEFELTVRDDKGAVGTDIVMVTVSAAPNEPPVANAGRDTTLTPPANSVQLDGSASYDPDGQIVTYQWTKISGPSPFTMTNPNTVNPTLIALLPGTYVIELVVTDNRGATATDRVTVIVGSGSSDNKAPVANAGKDQIVILPVNMASLDGSASSDPDGTIESYQWKQLSGPSTATIDNASSAKTVIRNLVEGEYVFELTVTDNKGATSTAIVTIKVVHDVNHPIDAFKLYPVPARTDLYFVLEGDIDNKTFVVMIHDERGVLVFSKKVTGSQQVVQGSVDVRLLRNGVYFFTIRSEDGSIKIVKSFLVIH